MHRLHSTILCAVALLGTFTAACGADVTEEFSQTVALNAGGEFAISNVNGQVEIATWNRNEVQILATKSAKNESVLKDVQVAVTSSGKKVEVEPASAAGRFQAGSVNGSIEADFPLQVTKARFGPSRSLDGVLGNGPDTSFSFKAVNGSIDIRSSETTASNNR